MHKLIIIIIIIIIIVLTAPVVQGDSGEKVNILGCDSIGHCEKEKFI
jgi:hypothetical protein